MVKYLGGKNRNEIPKIMDIKHDKFKFSGIIQMDKKGVFFLKCRNWKHDSLDLSSIPKPLLTNIPELN